MIVGNNVGGGWGGDGDNDDMLKDNGNDNQILVIMTTNSGNGIRDNDGLEGTMQITMGNNGDVMVEGIFYFLLFLKAFVGGGCWG
jgi:hypothetical protein